jgi:ankyrin repeat protein
MLLDIETDIQTRDGAGWTAFHCAARFGNLEVLKLLPSRGAIIEAKTNDNKTALYKAIEGRHARIVAVLLEKGACIDTADSDSGHDRPTCLAKGKARRDKYGPLLRLLMEKGTKLSLLEI